mgnify:CR=1 FL=1
MQAKIKYHFTAKLYRDSSENGWYFVSLPKQDSIEIRTHLQFQEEGWGRMKATAIIQNLEGNTAIWFDTKSKHNVLPIKSAIRKKLALHEDDELNVTVLV